jgi:hypothetical protein
MQQAAYILVVIALAGAAASWFAGAWFYVQTLRAISADPAQKGMMLGAVFNWMFVARRLRGAASAEAGKVNKAIVAFLVCLIVAVAAISVATNLARVPR